MHQHWKELIPHTSCSPVVDIVLVGNVFVTVILNDDFLKVQCLWKICWLLENSLKWHSSNLVLSIRGKVPHLAFVSMQTAKKLAVSID